MSRQSGMHISSRLVSSSQKREIMWNIIEPGDPYDIRKSMIAKLPGRKNFMGDHLELVCLLQAAEIERISEYVEEYKLKFREIERRELDRHSYEIQIKELTMQLSEEGGYRNQNLKLKQFLRKQTMELEQIRKKSGGYEIELSRKYEDSLRQVESLLQQNQLLKTNSNKMRIDFQQALNSKTSQNQQLLRRIKDLATAQSSQSSQKTQAYFKLEIQYKKLEFENKRVKQIVDGKNRQIEQLQNKSKQLIYQIQENNSQLRQYSSIKHTISQYESRFSLLGQQIDRLNLLLREKTGQLNDAHNNIQILEDELRRKTEYANQMERKKSQIDQRYMQLEVRMVESMKSLSGLDQSRNQVKNYESHLEKLSSEIERLNGVLRKKVQQLQEANRKKSQYEYELRKNDTTKRQVEDYRLKFGQFNRKVVEYENKIAIFSQEIERLNSTLKRKQDEINSYEQQYKSKSSQSEIYQKKVYQLQLEYKNEINRLAAINRNYESRINDLTHQNEMKIRRIQELTHQVRSSPSKEDIRMEQYYKSQIEKLTQIIHTKTIQIQRIERQPKFDSRAFEFEKERLVQQYELELTNRNRQIQRARQTMSEYEKRIVNSAEEIERLSSLLKRRPTESPEKNELAFQLKKVAQYESKFAIFNQEIQRLNETLRSKVNDNNNLEQRLRNYQFELQSSRRRQNDASSAKISELERLNASLAKQNQYLKEELQMAQDRLSKISHESHQSSTAYREYEVKYRQLNEEKNQIIIKLNEYEHQMGTLSQQIQRLNTILRAKVDENVDLEKKVRNISYEYEESQRRLIEYEGKITQLKREVQLNSQNLSRNAQYELENLKRRLGEAEKYNSQYQSRIHQYEERIRVFDQQRHSLSGKTTQTQRRLSEYENKIVILSQEIERLNQLLSKISQENNQFKRKAGEIDYLKTTIVTLEERYSLAAAENEELRRGVNQSKFTTSKISQDYEYKVRSLSQENEELLRKCRQYESKYSSEVKEHENLNSNLRTKVEQLNNLDSKLRASYKENEMLTRRIQQLISSNRKIGEYDNKITILSQEIERLNNILKSKLDEIKLLEGKCRQYENETIVYQRKIQQYQSSINREYSTKITFITQENEELKRKIKQLSLEINKIPELESNMARASGQVERLNNVLRTKIQEIRSLEIKLKNADQDAEKYRRRNEELENAMHRELKNQSSVFEQRVDQLTLENQNLRKNLRQLSDSNRKINEYESKVVLLSRQIERLNDLLAKYNKEVIPELQQRLRNTSHENDDLRRQLSELSQTSKGYQELLVRFKTTVQQNEQLGRRVMEYQTRMAQISGEVQRLNSVLRSKVEELNDVEGRLRQSLNQNQQLSKRLRQSSQVTRKISQYETRITFVSQEVDRLNTSLKIKVEQCSNYETQCRRYRTQLQTFQRRYQDLEGNFSELRNSKSLLEQKIASANQENDDLRRTVRQLSDSNRRISDYESRMALLSQEIQRLNNNLRIKTDERNGIENNFKNYKRQSETKISSLNAEIQEFRRIVGEGMSSQANKIAQYESKMLVLSQQIQRLNFVLKEHTYEIQIFQKKQSQYLSQIERLNNTLRLKVEQTTRWQQTCTQLKSRMKSYEQSMHVSASEYDKLKQAHYNLNEEYTKANKHLVEYEQSINKLYQEFERLQGMMQEMKKENYQLKIKLQESGNLVDKNRALSAEIDRLTRIVDGQNKDLEDLRLSLADQASLQKRINQDMALMVVLFAQIESLRKRVKQTEIQIQSVRRSSLAPFKV